MCGKGVGRLARQAGKEAGQGLVGPAPPAFKPHRKEGAAAGALPLHCRRAAAPAPPVAPRLHSCRAAAPAPPVAPRLHSCRAAAPAPPVAPRLHSCRAAAPAPPVAQVPAGKRNEPPFSMDANLLHISYEG
jgi:hypothetical protein